MLLLQDKTDPVEEEGGEKCSEENEIVAKKGDVLFPFPGVPPRPIPSHAPCTSQFNSMFHLNLLLPRLVLPFGGWRQSWPA